MIAKYRKDANLLRKGHGGLSDRDYSLWKTVLFLFIPIILVGCGGRKNRISSVTGISSISSTTHSQAEYLTSLGLKDDLALIQGPFRIYPGSADLKEKISVETKEGSTVTLSLHLRGDLPLSVVLNLLYSPLDLRPIDIRVNPDPQVLFTLFDRKLTITEWNQGNLIFPSGRTLPGIPPGAYGIIPIALGIHNGNSSSEMRIEISFSRSPATDLKEIRRPPASDPNNNIQLLAGRTNLVWNEARWGDWNNDGSVSALDVSPLASYFGRSKDPVSPNFFKYAEFLDANDDGFINAGDLSPIAFHFGASTGGYKVYEGTLPDGTDATPVVSYDRPAPSEDTENPPFNVSFAILTYDTDILIGSQPGWKPTFNRYYFVVPYDLLGTESTDLKSNIVLYSDVALPSGGWPKARYDARNSGRANRPGPNVPTLRWQFSLGSPTASSPVVAPDGTIYIGDSSGKLQAFDSAGIKKWEFLTGNSIVGTPLVRADGSVLVPSADGKLYLLSPKGAQIWAFDAGSPIQSSVALSPDGKIVFGTEAGDLIFLSPTSTLLASVPTGGPIHGCPMIPSPDLFQVGNENGTFTTYNFSTAQTITFDAGSAIESSSAYTGSSVVLTDAGGTVRSLDLSNNVNWSFSAGGGIVASPALTATIDSIFPSLDGTLYSLSSIGTLKWQTPLGGPSRSSPAISSDGSVYLGADSGKLFAISSSGQILFQFQADGPVSSSPAIGTDDTIYFSSEGGTLYAVGGTDPPPDVGPILIDRNPIFASESATFSVSASDLDEFGNAQTLTYQWNVEAGGNPFGTLVSPNQAVTAFNAPNWVDQDTAADVMVTVTGSNNVSITVNTTLTVKVLQNQLPVANPQTSEPRPYFYVDYNILVLPFATDPEGDTIRYLWETEAGDGGVVDNPSSPSPNVSYSTPGQKRLFLKVSDDKHPPNVWNIFQLDILIIENTLPTAAPEPVPPGTQFVDWSFQVKANATDFDGDPITYLWETEAGDGGNIVNNTLPIILITYSSTGAKTLHLKVFDDQHGGAYNEYLIPITVVVNQLPTANPQMDIPGDKFAYEPILVHANATDIDGDTINYQWIIPPADDGTIDNATIADPTVTYSTAGGKTLFLRVTDEKHQNPPTYNEYQLDIIVLVPQLMPSPWPKFHRDLQQTGRSPFPGLGGAGNTWFFSTNDVVRSSPAVDLYGNIHFGSSDGNIYKIDSAGNLVWSYTVGTAVTEPPALASSGVMYISGGSNNKLLAIFPNGTLWWEYTLSAPITTGVTIDTNGNLYFGALSQTMISLRPDGQERWTQPLVGSPHGTPSISEVGTINITDDSGRLYSYNQNGTLNWIFQSGTIIFTSPAVSDLGICYFGDDAGNLYAVDGGGNQLWKYAVSATSIRSSPAIAADGTIYFGTDDGRLFALDSMGNRQWDYLTGAAIKGSVAIGGDGVVYLPSTDNTLYAVNSDGSLRWQWNGFAPIWSSPAIGSDGTIYFGSDDNRLVSIGP